MLDSPKGNKCSPKKSVRATPALKTPKTGKKALGLKTPKTIGKTPKVPKSVKKATLWSEVVMKNLGKTPKKGAKVATVKGSKVKKVKKSKVVSKTPRKVKTASTSSTGHANSPETITITKKAKTPNKKAETPKTKTPKSPKAVTPKTPKVETPQAKTPKADTPKVKTPKADTPKALKAEKLSTPENQALVASAKKSSEKRFPKRLSHVGTHAVMAKSSTPDNKHLSKVRGTPRSARVSKGSPSTPFLAGQLSQSLSSTPGQLDVTDFDFESQPTPRVPLSALVSPLDNSSSKGRRGRKQRGGEELIVASMSTTPVADYTNVAGIRKLLKTPGPPPKSPMNDLTNVAGVKGLMKTPRAQAGPKNDLSDVKGVKQMMATPKTHKQQKDDLTDVQGVKKLMATPKMQKEPKNDLTNVQGVKKMMATPKTQKGPKNDLRNVAGVKKLMATPKLTKGPRNELDDLRGVKNLVGTPKTNKGPRNELDDLRGVKEVLGTPKPPPNTPVNNLSDLRGVKQLVGTPRQQKEAANVLEDLRGVKSLLKTPKAVSTVEEAVVDFTGVADLVATPAAAVEPSTSKRKVDSSLERSSSKKARVAEESEATTSRVARSPAKSPTKSSAKSPTKTARGAGSPGITIPKFDLSGAENQENIPPAEKAAVIKRGRGRKVEEPVEESREVEAEVTKVVDEVKYESMLKKDLLAECAKKGLELDGKSTKAVIIAALRASTNEKPLESEEPVEKVVVEEVQRVEKATTGRGRKGKIVAAVQQEEEQRVMTPVKKGRVPVVLEAEKEERIVTPVKTTRGKKVLKEVAVVEEQHVVAEEKPKRGRGGKQIEELAEPAVAAKEVEEDSTKKVEESSSQRRRGRKNKEEVPATISTEASSSLLEDPASPALKAVAKPKRGAKKGKAKVRHLNIFLSFLLKKILTNIFFSKDCVYKCLTKSI